jgi:hypothetical protein
MKTKNKLSLMFIFLLFVCVTLSCTQSTNYGPDYSYKWKIKTTYTNSAIDTIDCSYDSFNGNECVVILRGDGGGCINMQCGLRRKIVACGVRRFEILNFEKILIKK